MHSRRICALLRLLWTGACFLGVAAARGGPSFREGGGELILEQPRWVLAIDGRSGAIVRIEDRASGRGSLLRGGGDLWSLERHKEPPVTASRCALRHAWDADKGELRLDFDCPEAAVSLGCRAAEEGPAWRAEVRMKRGTLLAWRFPDAVEFDAPGVNAFVFPDNIGLAFTRAFFAPGGAGVGAHPVGPKSLERLTGDRCQMRPMDDERVSLKPGKDAAGWLPEWYLREMAHWRVMANRCPVGGASDLALVESAHGTWLSGCRLGGWGGFFRFGGRLRDDDARPQLASVIAVLARAFLTPPAPGAEVRPPELLAGKPPAQWPEPPKRIGILLPRPAVRPGARLEFNPDRWFFELGRQKWVVESGLEVVALRDAGELRAAAAEPRKWFAIINTLAEGYPAEDAVRSLSMIDAIREYVRNGGVWFDAGGGYPFFRAIVPARDVSFRSANRNFCDFAALDATAGRWALFGVQDPEGIYARPEAEIASSGPDARRVGRYRHEFRAFAKPGETWKAPMLQMTVGLSHRDALRSYGERNGFTRGLAAKAKAETVEKLKRCILLKVTNKTLAETIRVAESLPHPVLFHIAHYLRGGFDKEYPDHLPPNPAVGTSEDLARLVRICREKGHLFMPYTNPTWWCVNPKGPTFEKVGEAPLSRDLEGNLYPEIYGGDTTQGYAICAWHPAVRAANDVTRNQFTKEYPVDVLFQDQVGARGDTFDTNPAAPSPAAYLEGIHRIARVDSAFVPLGTEDGHDRLINFETMFCGLSAPWLPNRPDNSHILYEHVWPQGAWRIEPLALLLGHDKVLFYHHDLGGFVRNRLDLSITLAMGYGLSWWTQTGSAAPGEREWIDRLCRLQAAIGPRCAGRPLDGFDYPAPLVMESRWGDLTVTANLSDRAWKLDAGTAIAAHGFAAFAPDLEAGIFARRGGRDAGGGSEWIIREKVGDNWQEWRAGAETP